MKAKHKDNTGFILGTTVVREKISGKTKRRANESLSYNRTNPGFTEKIHHVEEIDETGNSVVVHDEHIQYPARRRNTSRKGI